MSAQYIDPALAAPSCCVWCGAYVDDMNTDAVQGDRNDGSSVVWCGVEHYTEWKATIPRLVT